MGGGEPRGDLPADPQHDRHRQRHQAGRQRQPLEVLHHKVGTPLVLAYAMDREHMRMADGRCGSALAEKPLPGPGVAGPRATHHLDGHAAVEQLVSGQVDPPHRTRADQAEHWVVADSGRHRLAVEVVIEPRVVTDLIDHDRDRGRSRGQNDRLACR